MRTTIPLICQSCGATFAVPASRLRHGRGRSCSPACQHAAVAKALNRSVRAICMGCGAEFARSPSHAGGPTGKGKYCSRACRDASRVGALHPQYLGVQREGYRGPNWAAQKRKARKRDAHTCQHCRVPGNDVHHIVPFRLFTDFLAANALENLVTLCKPCHRKADAAVQAQAGRAAAA